MTKKKLTAGAAVAVEALAANSSQPRAVEAQLHRLCGSIDAHHLHEGVTIIAMVRAYETVKALLNECGSVALTLADGSQRSISNIEDFCELALPVSGRRCRELASDVNSMGVALYQRAQALGFRTRDYRALHSLPDDDQAKVKAALESGDIEEARDALHTLAQANAALRAAQAEAKKSLDAKDRVIKDKSARLDRLQEQEEARRSASMPEREAAQIDDVKAAALEAESVLLRLVKVVHEVTTDPATEAAQLKAEQALHYIAQRFVDGCLEGGITIDLAERVAPLWTAASSERGVATPTIGRAGG